MRNKLTMLLLVLLLSPNIFSKNEVRKKENFDFDWKFTLSDNLEYAESDYRDLDWEQIQLPHDWNIKQQFEPKAGGSAAFLPEGIGWYRKTFKVPASYKDKLISILFDGIFHQSDVYINGHHLGFRPYGFCSIEYELSPYLFFDKENTIAVRVNCTGDRARWYTGAGIYRHAWLNITNPLHVDTYGTSITTPEVNRDQANVNIVTTISNSGKQAKEITILQRILDNSGKEITRNEGDKVIITSGNTMNIEQQLLLKNPQLWSTDIPNMYIMETSLKSGNKVSDIYTTRFGVRSIRFDKDQGFFLNDVQTKLKGVCLHFDAGCLGTAVPDRSNERKLEILKEYGINAIRAGHHQPPAEFLDMCDRMGFVFIDEAFDKWKSGYYAKYFDEWWQRDIENMILRDRNHPSVILWSIGNELQEAWDTTNTGVKRAEMLRDFVKKKDPSRLTILAAQNGHQAKFAGVTDVTGYNYLEARMISEKKKYPERIVLVSEELPYFRGEEGRIRSYTPLNPWQLVAENKFIAGGFIWSGVDYLGEAAAWPSKGWPNGLFDICMNEKPRAAYHRAMWNSIPSVSIAVVDPSLDIDHGRDLWQWPKMASHWNFPESYEGMVMEVRTTTNCESIEMYFDGKLMGKQNTRDFSNNTITWYLPYKPGKLEAKGFNGTNEVAHYTLVTSKATNKAVIKADRNILKADGQDLSHISILLEDENGNPVQTDDRKITIKVEGAGKLLGIDNGDLRRENSFAGNELKTYFGKALAIVQSTRSAGKMSIHIEVEGVSGSYSLEIESQPTQNR